MDDLFLLLFIISSIGIILGVIFPKRFVFWSKNKTRKKAFKGYLALLIVLFIGFGITTPNEQDSSTKLDTEETLSTVKNVEHQEGKTEQKEKQNHHDNEDNIEKQTVTKADIEKVESTPSPKVPVAKKIEKEKPKKKQVISNGKRVPVTLVRTVDGDTIKVRYKGKEENVRYLLIDTPESKKPGTCVQSFANEASERNKQLVNSGELTLEFEKSERDKYGRLLAYVFVDGKSVQEILLKEGYARVAYIYEPPYKYLSAYQKAENVAKDSKRKVWSQVGFATERGFNGCADRSSSAAKSNTSKSSTTKPAKQSTQKSTTTSQSAKVEIFKNCTELRKKYPNGVPKGHPAYQPKMDRDKDNFACEA